MKELTLRKIAEACHGTVAPEAETVTVTGVQSDSRRVRPGDLFVAIKGEKADGHDFVAMAASLGAKAALVARPVEAPIPTILVADTIRAYGDLAAAYREHAGITVIGITGSVGKTTTKEMTACLLARSFHTARTEGNHNNNLGLPMTILDMPDDTEVAVLEMGMNHFGEMAYLTSIARPDIAIITNIGTMHIEHLGSREGILQAKLEIFRGVPKNGVGVFNGDEPLLWNVRADGGHKKYYFGIENHACDVFATDIQELEDGMRFVVSGFGHRFELFVPVLGRHTVYNALAVIGAGLTLGIPLSKIADALKTASGVKGRVEVVPTPGKPYTVLIDYSHTPDSLENVLKTVRGFCKGRVIAVFGCGGDRDPFKRPIMGRIGAELADLCVVTSDNPRTEDPMAIIDAIVSGMQESKHPYVVIENRVEAIGWAMAHAQKDDVIVLCGKGHETYQEIGHEKRHLDEREVVADFFGREV